MSKVFIVLVNFNNFSDSIECMESLLKSNYQNYQILIIDNSDDNLSQDSFSVWINDNNYPKIVTSFPDLVYPIALKPLSHRFISENSFKACAFLINEKIVFVRVTNQGFAAANNIALNYILKYAESQDMIWVLNNDTVVPGDTLSKLVNNCIKKIDNKFIYGTVLLDYNRPNTIQGVCGKYNKWLGKHSHIGEGELLLEKYRNFEPGDANYIIGASMFFSKLFIEQAGVMCEDYFLYFEELDWVKTGQKVGFKMFIVTDALIYHKGGASIVGSRESKKDTSIAEYYSITNRVRFIKKWYPVCLLTVLPGVVWAIIKRLFSGKFKLVCRIIKTILVTLFSKKV